MALKPRTKRRIILLGSLAGIVLLLMVGYFVVRPMQRNRTINSMRTEGIAAAQEGNHIEAVTKLGRYLNQAETPEPELLLMFSRSRVKWLASDGGHISIAIRFYRDYLAVVPDDVVAAKELLPLFNTARMSIEARDLAVKLRTTFGDKSSQTLQEEITARMRLDEDEQVIDSLFEQLVSHKDAEFKNLFQYAVWLEENDRLGDAQEFIHSIAGSEEHDFYAQLIATWLSWNQLKPTEITNEVIASYVTEITSLIGIDPSTGLWISEPQFLDSQAVTLIDTFLNRWRRPDLSLAVRLYSAQTTKDTESMIWAARRLYWTNQLDELAQLGIMNADGDLVTDVLGYQVLALDPDEDADQIQTLLEQLDLIVLDFRSTAWHETIDVLALLDDKKFIQARQEMKSAIGQVPNEPTFRLIMGDIHSGQGRFDEAANEWLEAQRFAFQPVGVLRWGDPMLRLIQAYSQAGRLGEAIGYVNDLVNIAPQNPVAIMVWLQSYAALARADELDREAIERTLINYESSADALPADQQALIAPQIATLYASVGRNDAARVLLGAALAASPPQRVVLEVLEIDQRYKLGIAEAAGIDTSDLATSTPTSALRYAMNIYAQNQDVEEGLEVLDRGVSRAEEGDAHQWALMRARFLDVSQDPRAQEAWSVLREQNPDDISLLMEIAESNAIGKDLDAVNVIIDDVVERTSTAGLAIPSRMRLARASAIVRQSQVQEGGVTKKARKEAIEITRSVVANQQNNIKARTMLARLLALKPSPAIDPADSFEPDIPGAISQYINISRQHKGTAARGYLLEAVDLSFESGDVDSAKRFLIEFSTRFKKDFEGLAVVAQRLENINELDLAIEIYGDIYRDADTAELMINAGLSLANGYLVQGERQLVRALLQDLSSEPAMNAEQIFRLASMHTKSGYPSEGNEIANSGESYGLDPVDAMLVYARYAGVFVSREEYERALKEVVAIDQTNEEAWTLLVRRLIQEQRFDEAQELVAQANAAIPESKNLEVLTLLARGELASGRMLLESGAIESNEIIEEAVDRVDAFIAAKETSSRQELVSMLTSMLDKFEQFSPIQRFALSELNVIGADPALIARYADRAARYMPQDSLIMRIATNAYLRIEKPVDAIRVGRLWRANAVGASIEADVVIAKAMIQMEDYRSASDAVRNYVAAALASSTKPISADVILVYSHAQLMEGEDPQITAARLLSLFGEGDALVKQVWLNLATGSLPTHEESAHWLEVLTEHASEDELPMIGNAWLIVIDRFNTQRSDYAQKSIDIFEKLLESQEPTPEILSTLARGYAALAQAQSEDSERDTHFQHASQLMDQADELNPTNLGYLSMAARYATMTEDFSAAESRYRMLLSREINPGGFLASIQNNLAMLIERQSSDPTKLAEALDLSTKATTAIDLSAFWGTRGWVELALGQLNEAEVSFEHAINKEQRSIEGWVGLAIVQHQLGESRVEDATESFARVLLLVEGSEAIADDLLERLEQQGRSEWAAELSR